MQQCWGNPFMYLEPLKRVGRARAAGPRSGGRAGAHLPHQGPRIQGRGAAGAGGRRGARAARGRRGHRALGGRRGETDCDNDVAAACCLCLAPPCAPRGVPAPRPPRADADLGFAAGAVDWVLAERDMLNNPPVYKEGGSSESMRGCFSRSLLSPWHICVMAGGHYLVRIRQLASWLRAWC